MAIKIPLTFNETGIYNVNFGGYLNSAVYYQGVDKETTLWEYPENTYNTLTVDYSNAYMALPKRLRNQETNR